MDFGLTFEKLLLIGVIAALIIGPERLPKAAETFAGFVRRAGEYVRETKSKMRDEIGPEIDDVDWRKLDPRQYDPRRIIRDALMDDTPSTAATSAAAGGAAAAVSAATPVLDPPRSPLVRPAFTSDAPPPFDLEAT
ncbi:Sec-independent protein translocase TatB [Microbacterium sp. AK031]|uniref:Sec-independent protein translocase TatB n=1 Tax=Microbacterium sp. AK031 TaxID=2723076 RepID=UPI002167F851|nr:Sec-independent protein translocase TatB [Microbacterium sp. AK031]MCS3842041.1 sec-independent protein translocase protein TatB [Microbacterium sp. AK031]